jgi:hypothetical protein
MRKATVFVLLSAALLVHGCAARAVDDSASSEEPLVAAVGEPARDGKFRITVKEAKCGAASVGTGTSQRQAEGKFCVVTVDVKNVDREPCAFLPDDQKAYSANGIEYPTNPAAGFSANERNNNTLLNEIRPGDLVTFLLVFDVPNGTALTKIHLHESYGSVGIIVPLG